MLEFIYNLFCLIERRVMIKRCQRLCGVKVNCLGKISLNTNSLSVGNNVTLYPGVNLWGHNISIGDNTAIGENVIINSSRRVVLGNDVSIAAQCYIIDSNHGAALGTSINQQESIVAENGIEIGDDVWIGAQCVILKGAEIENGAIIGANSVVNSHIPANAIAFGTPAKVHSFRK